MTASDIEAIVGGYVRGTLARREHRGGDHHSSHRGNNFHSEDFENVAAECDRAAKLRERRRGPPARQALRELKCFRHPPRALLIQIARLHGSPRLREDRDLR